MRRTHYIARPITSTGCCQITEKLKLLDLFGINSQRLLRLEIYVKTVNPEQYSGQF